MAHDHADAAHGPNWMFYDRVDVEWLGLEANRRPFHPEIYPLSLSGLTRGHCGVGIRDGEGWLLQCADPLPLNVEHDVTPAWLNRMVLGPHGAPSGVRARAPDVRMLACHMRREFIQRQPAGRRPTASG